MNEGPLAAIVPLIGDCPDRPTERSLIEFGERQLSTTFQPLAALDLVHKSSRRPWEMQDEQMADYVTPDWLTERRRC